jgi:hypothetical protein
MANWSFLTSHAPGADVHRTRPRRAAATSRPAWASPSAAPTASSPTSPGPVGDQAERWPATATRSRRTCRCRRLPARNLPFGEVLAVVAGRPRLSSGRFFTPRTLVEPRPFASARPAWWPTCREPRDHLRRPRRPVPLQPELPADAVPLTLPKGVVSGWGDTRRPGTPGWDPLPEPDGCSPAGFPASPSLPPSSANACMPWASTPCPAAVLLSSTSPPRCPQQSSPTCCTSHQAPRSDGRTRQEATGPATPPNSPGNAFTRPDEPAPSTSVQVSGYFVEFTASATRTPT